MTNGVQTQAGSEGAMAYLFLLFRNVSVDQYTTLLCPSVASSARTREHATLTRPKYYGMGFTVRTCETHQDRAGGGGNQKIGIFDKILRSKCTLSEELKFVHFSEYLQFIHTTCLLPAALAQVMNR